MKGSKTLYVSDLDGTLLRHDQTVSPFTAETINTLTARGMLFPTPRRARSSPRKRSLRAQHALSAHHL